MRKRFITLFALLVLLPVMAFATEVVITWEWMLDDPQITGFRYQLNGEDPDNWTVVDGTTSSCVIQHLDGATEYTLYLQQTFDGVNWSPSAMSTAMPLFSAEAVVAQAPVVNEPTAEVQQEPVATTEEVVQPEVSNQETTTEEPATVEAPVVAKTRSPYYTTISLRGSGAYTLATMAGATGTNYDQFSASVGIGLGFNNIIASSKVGLGLNIDTDFLIAPHDGSALASLQSFFLDTSITDYSLRVTIAPEVEFNLNKVVIDIAPLVDVTLLDFPIVGTLDYTPDFYSHLLLGYGAQLGIAYNIGDHLQIGTDAKFRKFGGMADWNTLSEWGVEVTPSIKLKF